MNAEDYNNYMLNLYREVNLKLITSHFPEDYEVNHIFENAASIFNKNIANEYLNILNRKNYDLLEKIDSYPYMFWKTREAELQVTIGLEKLQEKYREQIESTITASKMPSKKSFYQQGEELVKANQLLNGELGNYDDSLGTGIFKQFSKDMLKISLLLGDNINVANQIEQFASHVYKKFNEENLAVDLSEFPKYLHKVFKNTPINKSINNIDFDTLFKSEEKKISTLKV